MASSFKLIKWNPKKKRYDAILAVGIIIYVLVFWGMNAWLYPNITKETLAIRTTGTLAILMLHLILLIAPLSRFIPQIKVLSYNSRHLGVTLFFIALLHALLSMAQYHGGGNATWLDSLFTSNTRYFSFSQFPYMVLGFFALIILFFMAITSHDYWVKKLGNTTWKKLHKLVYVAYTLVIFHVLLGRIQSDDTSLNFILLLLGAGLVCFVHIRAACVPSTLSHRPLSDEGYKKWSNQMAIGLFALAAILAATLALFQNPFSEGKYEKGKERKITGFLRLDPVPHLRTYAYKNSYEEPVFQSFLLTGKKKLGAKKTIQNIIQKNNLTPSDSLYVTLKGQLIYNDGKGLLELVQGEKSFVQEEQIPDSLRTDSVVQSLNPYHLETVLQGEIIDPKCYFGAMKPSSGKIHKSCAIRCISGGIPPVLKVKNKESNSYYILYGLDKKPVNQRILDYVAEPVEVQGRFERMDNWFILYIAPSTAITRL